MAYVEATSEHIGKSAFGPLSLIRLGTIVDAVRHCAGWKIQIQRPDGSLVWHFGVLAWDEG